MIKVVLDGEYHKSLFMSRTNDLLLNLLHLLSHRRDQICGDFLVLHSQHERPRFTVVVEAEESDRRFLITRVETLGDSHVLDGK